MIHADQRYDESSVVQLIDDIIFRAITQRASDIHFESDPESVRVRYRVDGVLYDQPSIPGAISLQALSRVKVLGRLDIAEKRVPQDGKFARSHNGQQIDLRVSSFPSLYGEKIVVRILDRSTMMRSLDHLGLPVMMATQLNEIISRQHGFFLVVGPTGSGKTTTLYAALSLLNTPEKNITTLEDPVEYNIAGITQGQVHPDAGFTFARGIRAMLRQDPDVVMVGEIRDKETARIAIEAALTGHLVLSTLHTNDAPRALMRLMDMGIEPFLLNASLSGIMAQRLVRALCSMCKQQRFPTDEECVVLERLSYPLEVVYEGAGCDSCFGLGYKGRTGIFELLRMTEPLRSLVVQNPVFADIENQAIADGMIAMQQHGLEQVKAGVISLAELMRVVS